jgi:hypothetical protein
MSMKSTAAIDQEIAQEKAESLGLAGRLLETALADLRSHDTSPGAPPDTRGEIREGLVARAAYRLQNVIVQRESQGLRDPQYVFQFYGVPREVVLRLGVRTR